MITSSGHGRGCDWWSLGCLLYEMVVGHTPWMLDEDRTPTFDVADAELSRRISSPENELAYPDGKEPSAPLCELLAALLVREADARLGCSNSGVRGVFEHPAFAAVDFAALEAGTMSFPPMPAVAGKGGAGGEEEEADKEEEAEDEEPPSEIDGSSDEDDDGEEKIETFFDQEEEDDDEDPGGAPEWDRFF